jgi:hypothetical protein
MRLRGQLDQRRARKRRNMFEEQCDALRSGEEIIRHRPTALPG